MIEKLNNIIYPSTRSFLSRVLGSFFILLCSISVTFEKLFDFYFDNCYGFQEEDTLVWMVSQTLTPIILVITRPLKPFAICYLFIIYFFSIQLYWIFDPNIPIYLYKVQLYAAGSVAIFILSTYLISKIKIKESRLRKKQEAMLIEGQRFLDLFKNKHLTTVE